MGHTTHCLTPGTGLVPDKKCATVITPAKYNLIHSKIHSGKDLESNLGKMKRVQVLRYLRMFMAAIGESLNNSLSRVEAAK
eukprot:augustus_masked-scaffold_24-processed-gene-3.43-mRNA-1 protein AED:1.00 eAED:1.00 QI:0/-1/0/0/-1/1/1/0/80